MEDGSKLVQSVIAGLLREEHGMIEELKQTQEYLLHAATHARIELYRELLVVLDGQAQIQRTRLEKAEMRSEENSAVADSLEELVTTWQENLEAIETIQTMLQQAIAFLLQA